MKYIKTYEEFNGPNLGLNYNIDYDFKTYQGKQFDGGDGPSATDVPHKYKQVKDDFMKDSPNPRRKQIEREEKRKKFSKEYRIAKLMDYQTDDEIIRFSPYVANINSNSN